MCLMIQQNPTSQEHQARLNELMIRQNAAVSKTLNEPRRSYDQQKLITKACSANHNDRQPITITLRLITNQPECIAMILSTRNTNRQKRAQNIIAASLNRNKQISKYA